MPSPRLLLAVLAVAAVAALPPVAAGIAAPGTKGCAEAVLRDWHEGHIGEHYAAACYRAALATLPEDMRIYSTAADDIQSALHARLTALARRARAALPRNRRLLSVQKALPASSTDAALPLPVLVAAGAALVLVGVAGASHAARRWRRR